MYVIIIPRRGKIYHMITHEETVLMTPWKPRSIEFPFQIIWIQELPRHNTYFVKLNEHLSFLKTTLLLRNVMHFWWQCSQEPPFICYHLSLIRKKSIALVFLQQQCTTAISWGPWKYNKLIRVHAWYCSKIVSSARDNKLLVDIAPQKFEFNKKKKCTCILAAAVHNHNFLGPLKIQ